MSSESRRISVDFDKTITDPDGGTYFTEERALPNEDVVEWINEQYRDGATIIVHTARPWSESALTAAQLTEWGVRWHGLRMDKGSADLYVDDKAIRPSEVLES